MSQPKGPHNVMSGAAASLDSNDPSTENISLKLLGKENKTFKRQLTYKICSKSDVRDLLQCGGLYACSSKLLTHCPSCKKTHSGHSDCIFNLMEGFMKLKITTLFVARLS